MPVGRKLLRWLQGLRRWRPLVGRYERPQEIGRGWTEHARAGQRLRWNAAAMLDPDISGADYGADLTVVGVCGVRTAPVGAPRPPGRAWSDWLSAAERRV